MKKMLCSFLALVICFCVFAVPVAAVSVGEEVTFEAGSEKEHTSGSSYVDTRTEAEKAADSINSTNHKNITNKCKEIIEVLKEEQIPVYAQGDDTITLVWKEDVPKEDIEWIAGEGSDYEPGTNHETGRPNWDELITMPKGDELDSLFNEVIPGHQGVKPGSGMDWFDDWIKMEPDDNEVEIGDFVTDFPEKGGYWVENHIPGPSYIVDFDTFMTRYEMLHEYLDNFASSSDTVDVNYIVQYSIRSTVQDKLKTSTPQYWPGTTMTHFWEIECVGAPDDGYSRTPLSAFAGSEFSQIFYYAGDYRVTATQMLKNSYSDAYTWNVCEYLVIEETGQVIWKNETFGARISDEQNARPLTEQGLWNVKYYNPDPNAEYVYVTKYDQLWTITNNVLVGGQTSPDTWGDEHTTERIE